MTDHWIPISEMLEDYDQRPSRQFIRAEGWCQHSGMTATWARVWCDVAFISKDTHLGYRQSDLDRIMKDGDMDGIDRITHWMPAKFPAIEVPT